MFQGMAQKTSSLVRRGEESRPVSYFASARALSRDTEHCKREVGRCAVDVFKCFGPKLVCLNLNLQHVEVGCLVLEQMSSMPSCSLPAETFNRKTVGLWCKKLIPECDQAIPAQLNDRLYSDIVEAIINTGSYLRCDSAITSEFSRAKVSTGFYNSDILGRSPRPTPISGSCGWPCSWSWI